MWSKSNLNTLLVLIISFFSFIFSVFQAKYYYDGHHWGLMLSNAIDLIDGKIPYEEIFIQYGIVTTLLHVLFLKLGDLNILSLFYGTSFIYSLSILIIYKQIKKFFNSNYGLLVVVIMILIHPFVNYPWHNYLGFFLLLLSFNFFNYKKKINYFVSGFFLGINSLLYEKQILIFFIFIIFFFLDSIIKKKIRFFGKFLLGFIIPLIIFFYYLKKNNLIDIWILYQKISTIYFNEGSLIATILNYFKKLYFLSYKNILFEPYWIFFSFLIFLNCIYLFLYFFQNHKNKEKFFFPSLMSIIYLINTIHSLNSFRFITGSFIGIFILIYFLDKIKSQDSKIIIISILILFLSLGVNFKKSENNLLYVSSNSYNENITNNDFIYFKGQKWPKDVWINLNYLKNKLNEIKKKCQFIRYGVNLTNDSYYYILISEKFITYQKIPFFDPYNSISNASMNLINQSLYSKINKHVNENSLLIVANENFKNDIDYKEIKINYSYYHKQKSIFVPNKCKL